RDSPTQVGAERDWVAVSGGDAHTCGIRAGGNLWCWGSNVGAQLGDGTLTNSLVPEQIAAGETWAQVSAGYVDSCAIAMDGGLWCWGSNGEGELGDGTFDL